MVSVCTTGKARPGQSALQLSVAVHRPDHQCVFRFLSRCPGEPPRRPGQLGQWGQDLGGLPGSTAVGADLDPAYAPVAGEGDARDYEGLSQADQGAAERDVDP